MVRFKHQYKGSEILVSLGMQYKVFYPIMVGGSLDYKLTKDEFASVEEAKEFIDVISGSENYPDEEEITALRYAEQAGGV